MWVLFVLPLIILFEYWWSCWLIIRHRGILDSILLEDVSFFICDLGICCFSWSRGYIQCFIIGSWLLQLFSYRDRVIMRVISSISVIIFYIQSFMASYWLTWFIGGLEGGYVDYFEDLSWLYILPWIILFMPACY